MKPIDYRNETWAHVRERITPIRMAVYRAFELHGACTTRQLAEKSGIDLLSLRPRVTELYQIGLVELLDPNARGDEGVYRAVPWLAAIHRFEKRKTEATQSQMNLL